MLVAEVSVVASEVASSFDLLRGAGIAIVTAVVLVTGLVIAGFVLLFRRRGDARLGRGGSSIAQLSTRAGSLLVRTDDALREADNELGFAIAQFGADASRGFANQIEGARQKVAEAFRLKQSLDDAYPESPTRQREWTFQVIALCEQAQSALDDQSLAFAELREAEANAAGTLDDLLDRIAATESRLAPTRDSIVALERRFAKSTLAAVRENPNTAEQLLESARTTADAAARDISQEGVNAVTVSLQRAAHDAHSAALLLDAVDRVAADLDEADRAVTALVQKTERDLVEARAERDKAPDADTGAGIIAAIAGVEKVLAGVAKAEPADPVRTLDSVGEAVARLDLALATARNQKQRLEHARAALVGTLVSARSQISTARDYIGSRGGGVDARTRLAEAERQLMLAEVETDPVAALDTARRAVTHARDADALARYETMHS